LVVNIHELILEPNGTTFTNILLIGEEQNETNNAFEAKVDSDIRMMHFVNAKPGPKPFHQKYPAIVNETLNFIQLHSFSAQSRRRTDVSNASGVSLSMIHDHLINTIPGLTHIGKDTIHHLFMPPNRKTKSSKRFKFLNYS